MRIWGGLPTTGPAAPPSSPGRHRADRAPARAQITPPLPARARGRRRHRPPAGGSAGPAAAGPGREPGALRADAGYLAAQLARAAPGGHIAFAVGARRIAPQGAAAGRRRRTTGGGGTTPPGRRGGLPARLVPGGYVAAAPPGRAGLLTGRCGEPTVA